MSTDNSFDKAVKLNQLVMNIMRQCASIKLTAQYDDGPTARWIEREMDEMINKVKVCLNEFEV